jgi:hypothetical protein
VQQAAYKNSLALSQASDNTHPRETEGIIILITVNNGDNNKNNTLQWKTHQELYTKGFTSRNPHPGRGNLERVESGARGRPTVPDLKTLILSGPVTSG